MDFKQIKELIRLVNQTDLSELKIETENFKISLRSKGYTEAMNKGKSVSGMSFPSVSPVVQSPMVVPSTTSANLSSETAASPSKNETSEKPKNDNLFTIKSPMIGTFYRSAGPDKPPYIKIGDTISKGDVLCIVEAMKLFNEIEAEVNGKVVEVLLDDSSPVEYDQELFRVELV